MDTKKLRQKILDLAIRGKLVSQDPNDEPASVLLDRIRAEKERLIAEGKIKRPKKAKASSDASHYQHDFQPPFEIPASWEWVKLEEIAKIGTGATPSRSNKAYWEDGSVNWVGSSATSLPFVEKPTALITQKALSETNCEIFPIGSIIMAMYGEGKTRGQISELLIPSATNQACAGIILLNANCKKYVKYFLTGNYWHLRELAEGGNQPNLNLSKIASLQIPLPPIEEQLRIVEAIDSFFKSIEILEIASGELEKCISDGKSKILELAMQGKLVPQDPADEPAADMLRRINPKAEIITDNPHYPQLPDNWVKVRLKDLAILLSGRDLPSEECSNNQDEVPYLIGASNIDNGLFKIVRWTSKPQVLSELNDILISCKGTIGELVINNYGLMHIARQFMAIRCSKCINPDYLYYAIAERMNEIRKKANGIIPGISRPVLLDLIICVPPLAEQKRVVLEIQRYYSAITLIQTALNL